MKIEKTLCVLDEELSADIHTYIIRNYLILCIRICIDGDEVNRRDVQIALLEALTPHIGRASQEETKHQICSEMMWVCGL